MDQDQLRDVLERVARGAASTDQAEAELTALLRRMPFEDLGFARVDHHRAIRQGFPEVVYGAGKTPAQVAAIAERIVAAGQPLLVTRTDEDAYANTVERFRARPFASQLWVEHRPAAEWAAAADWTREYGDTCVSRFRAPADASTRTL